MGARGGAVEEAQLIRAKWMNCKKPSRSVVSFRRSDPGEFGRFAA